jgi:predicted SAM-dependent methyltransferase
MSLLKINFGSGTYPLPGWVNVDADPECQPDVVADLSRFPLPFPDGCAQYLHSEDFFDQLPLEQACEFLRECHRILAPGGVMRLLTPDLHRLADLYVQGDPELKRLWTDFVGLPLRTGSLCEIMNLAMRLGGHTFLWDAPTLTQVLAEHGFEARAVRSGESAEEALRGIDLRNPQNSVSMYFDCYRL